MGDFGWTHGSAWSAAGLPGTRCRRALSRIYCMGSTQSLILQEVSLLLLKVVKGLQRGISKAQNWHVALPPHSMSQSKIQGQTRLKNRRNSLHFLVDELQSHIYGVWLQWGSLQTILKQSTDAYPGNPELLHTHTTSRNLWPQFELGFVNEKNQRRRISHNLVKVTRSGRDVIHSCIICYLPNACSKHYRSDHPTN